MVNISGIAITKLDGTAKGGVIVAICDELKIPVRFIGVGEKYGRSARVYREGFC